MRPLLKSVCLKQKQSVICSSLLLANEIWSGKYDHKRSELDWELGKTRQPKWQMAGIWKSVVRGSHLPEWLWVRRGMWPWKSTLKSTVLMVNFPQKRSRIFYVCLLKGSFFKEQTLPTIYTSYQQTKFSYKKYIFIERNSYEAQNNFLLYLMFVFLAILLHKTQ